MQNEGNIITSQPLYRRVRLARRALELSQLEVALQAGISQSQFSLFEHGHANLEPEALNQVFKMLGMGTMGITRERHDS